MPNNFKNWSLEKRLIFFKSEKPPSAGEKKDTEKLNEKENPQKSALLEIQSRARHAKREEEKKTVIDQAKSRAEIKAKFQGMKLTSDELKTRPDGQLEQDFTFGDKNLQGKLILPKDSDPSKPTNYLFTFSDNPDQADLTALQKSLEKNQEKLGNTIIVQLKMPDGESVEVNGKKANLIKSMVEDLQHYQNLPELSKLQKANTVFALSNPEKAEQINQMLEEYTQENPNNDLPVAFTKTLQADNLDQQLDQIGDRLKSADAEEVTDEEQVKKVVRGGGGGGGQRSTGGSISANSSSPTEPTESASTSPATVPGFINDLISGNNSDKPKASPNAINTSLGIPESANSNEKEPIKGFVGFFGDSNLEAFAEPKRFFNLSEGGKGYAVRGYNTRQVLSQLGLDKDGNLKNGRDSIPTIDQMTKVVINCGLNDVGSNLSLDEIKSNLKIIVNYFQKKGKQVYLTTLSPFGGYQSQYWKPDSKRDGKTLEERRLEINQYILSDLQGQSGVHIIPLHLTKAEGGVASGQKDQYGIETLDPTINSGDHLHFKPQEFSKLLSRYLTQTDAPPAVSTSPTENTSIAFNNNKADFWRNNVYGAPKGFTGGGVSQAAAIRSREILNAGGMKPGEYKEETIDGVTYAFVHEGHPKSPSDMETPWHPSISVYPKKNKKKEDTKSA
jgi:hypothetical protein